MSQMSSLEQSRYWCGRYSHTNSLDTDIADNVTGTVQILVWQIQSHEQLRYWCGRYSHTNSLDTGVADTVTRTAQILVS